MNKKNRTHWWYGIGLAILVIILKQVEYRHSVRYLKSEQLVAIVGVIFMGLGVWVSWQYFATRATSINATSTKNGPDTDRINKLGLSKRELEIFQLLAAGYSNQEIATELFISLNTVKTHISNLYQKLDINRRTQAVQLAHELGLMI